ncbi:MAG: hypothetical protein MHMPM18_004820 [Marteilia pararefringens]
MFTTFLLCIDTWLRVDQHLQTNPNLNYLAWARIITANLPEKWQQFIASYEHCLILENTPSLLCIPNMTEQEMSSNNFEIFNDISHILYCSYFDNGSDEIISKEICSRVKADFTIKYKCVRIHAKLKKRK